MSRQSLLINAIAAIIILVLHAALALLYQNILTLEFAISLELALALMLILNEEIECRLPQIRFSYFALILLAVISLPNALLQAIYRPELYDEAGNFIGSARDLLLTVSISIVIWLVQISLGVLTRKKLRYKQQIETNLNNNQSSSTIQNNQPQSYSKPTTQITNIKKL